MIMSENTLDLQSLRFALTIVMGNDIVVPECDYTLNPLDRYPRVDGYIWSYKGHHVRVDLSFIANATRMIMGQLDEGVEHTRLYVKHELYKLISKQRREGDA